MGKRRHARISDDEEDETEVHVEKKRMTTRGGARTAVIEEEEEEMEEEEEEEEEEEDGENEEDEFPILIGDCVRVSGKGREKKKHYNGFEFDGNQFDLGDSVLLSPDAIAQKPYVAIIRDVTQDIDSNVMVNTQWFYRPEEADKKGGGNWQSQDTRELFYSIHQDNVPAESVMHKCVVHFIPSNKKLPVRSQHPGFIVQKVYDTVEKKLWKLTDKDYKDHNQSEIELLIQKTRERLGEFVDIETEVPSADGVSRAEHEEAQQIKWNRRRKNMGTIDVSRNDEGSTKSDANMKSETPGSCNSDSSEYHVILSSFQALTMTSHRDNWLKKLLVGMRFVCKAKDSASEKDKAVCNGGLSKSLGTVNGSHDNNMGTMTSGKIFIWPDDIIPAITGLEKAVNEALGSDFMKYNQKMRSLDFNLKNNLLLARRLLNKELEPSVILNMSPNDLKNGLTAEEKTTKEPDRSDRMQMTDTRCSRCMEKKVGVADVIHAGGSGGDRYQLECIACGHTWYASRDDITSLTIDTANVVGNVGTAPWATLKFESVEKMLVSPRDSEKPAGDITQKTAASNMPVLESHASFNRVKAAAKPAADDAQKSKVKSGNVGTASKFENVEKKLASPRDSEKPITQKTAASNMPVLESQVSFNRVKAAAKPAADDAQKSKVKPGNVGTASKFENVEKKLASPRDSEKPITQKTAASNMPVLESQASFNRVKAAAKPAADDAQKSKVKPGNVGTASKFENVEKKLASPRDSEKPASDITQKTAASKMPVLESQVSFNRVKATAKPAADDAQKSKVKPGNVGMAWKFENVEKKLGSLCDSEKPITQKTAASKMPVLESQSSFNRVKAAAKHAADYAQKYTAKPG